jgi:hypothetical protein
MEAKVMMTLIDLMIIGVLVAACLFLALLDRVGDEEV